MSKLSVVLCLLLSGCGYAAVTPERMAIAVQLCAPHGGVLSISGGANISSGYCKDQRVYITVKDD